MTYKIFLNGLFCNALKNLLTGFVLLSLFTLTSATVVYAFAPAIYVGPIPNDDFKFGQVMARAIVIDPETNQPILVRFNEDGSEAGVVSTGNIPASEVGIVSADDYRFFELQLEAYKIQYEDTLAKGAELLSRKEYLSRTFKASDNQTEVVKPVLPEGVNSVFVRAQVRRLPKPEGQQSEPDESLILLRFPFDLSQDTQVADESVTILISKEGQIIQQSEKRIGYRNGFFGDPNEAQNERDYQVKNDDEVFGPIVSTYVYVDQFAYIGGADVSDKDGKYAFRFYMPLCPIGGYTFITDVWGELRYKNNLPTGSPSIPYYVRTPGYSYCYAQLAPAFLVPELLAIQATSATFTRQSNLIVDVTFLTGRLAIKNIDGEPVPIGETTYTEFEEEAEDILQRHYDFNRDDKEDFVVQGKVVQETDPDSGEEFSKFIQCADDNCNKQGIFFDGVQDDELDFPDLVRILDQELRIDEEVGVLKSISLADVRNTDILVFRDATGQLIMERRGLKEEEPDPEERRAIQYDPEANETGYRVMLRGRYDTTRNIGGTNFRQSSDSINQSYKDWATKNQLTEPFRERISDQPRPGEIVTVVAINRATGYMGTAKTKLQISNLFTGGADDGQRDAADISVRVPKITLQPPNLKIWAEREYVVEKGVLSDTAKENERKYLIGSEGASLTSDTLIRVYTEWLDEDGYPLPKELGLDNGEEYGLTGRLAKVAGQNTLTGVNGSSDLAEFAIEPGRHTQVIREKNNLNQAEHFYIHVIGKGKDQECVNQTSCPSFSQNGKGIYAGRPALLTPFKVPLFDENTTWLEYRSYRDVLDEFNDENSQITERPEKPLPSYVWQYRPEYQFSQYELAVQEINREITGEDPNNSEIIDIIDAENPVIASSDDLISILYSLVSSQFDRLDPIDGEQELILALGEEEQLITIGEDQTITFENLDSLGLLDPEDLLTIRLYTNNDAGNILWEYAYMFFNIGIEDANGAYIGDDVAYISADDPEMELATVLVGYSSFSEKKKEEVGKFIQWRVISGNASFSPSTTEMDDAGTAKTKVMLSPEPDNIVKVEARLAGDDDSKARLFDLGVIPGKPANITASQSGSAKVRRRGSIEVKAKVVDKNGNLVLDGTGVQFIGSGDIRVTNSTGLSSDGEVTATVVGGSASGTYPLKIISGEAEVEIPISIGTLQVGINDLPSEFVAGETYDLKAKVNSLDPSDLAGVYIDLGSDFGVVMADSRTTDVNGEIGFKYTAPHQAMEIQIGARLDMNVPVVNTIDVVSPENSSSNGLNSQFANDFLIAGNQGNSTVDVDIYTGQAASVSLPNDISLQLKGEPNANWSINLEDSFFANREPVYFNRFKSVIYDETREYESTYVDIERITSPYTGFFAINLDDGADQWSVDRMALTTSSKPGYSFWLNPKSNGQVLNAYDGNIVLTYSNGSLSLEAQAQPSPAILAASNISSDAWHKVSLGVRDNELYLSIDDSLLTLPLTGFSLQAQSQPAVTLGDGFTGEIAGLVVYDWNSPALLEASQLSGVYNASGNASVSLLTSSAYTDNTLAIPTTTVAVNTQDGQKNIINILDKTVVEKYAADYASVFSMTSVSAEEVLSRMPLNVPFPDVQIGGSALAKNFATTPVKETASKNVVAAIAWLRHEPQYNLLADKVMLLQRYFTSAEYPRLAEYAADYFQEAVVSASSGDPFWMRTLSTSLLVWAELIELRPDLAEKVALSISSRADFWMWTRVMALPANGWIADIPPIPRPDMTCDKILPNINVNTFLETSLEPCRATGAQMAFFLDSFVEGDDELGENPRLLTSYVETLLSAIKQMPYEFKRLFPPVDGVVTATSPDGLLPKANAVVWFYAVRGLAVAIKQGLRKAGAVSAANFVAFLQGGTTSRVETGEMLMTLAYLGSRLTLDEAGKNTCPDSDCEPLNKQVSDTVIADIGLWLTGVGLSKKGKLDSDESIRRVCTVTNGAHGKGFELLGTAAYHALFEFGGQVGVSNPQKYKILLSDPRKGEDLIEVPIMRKKSENSDQYVKNSGSPFQRKPDLVLVGDGEGKTQWIEFKSWSYKNSYFNKTSKKLNDETFPLWNGKSRKDNFRANAHKQHFLDYAATRDELQEAFWEKQEGFNEYKPKKHRAWVQIWKPGKRQWRALKKVGDKYRLEDNLTTINVGTPWILEKDITNGLVTGVPNNFQALQQFLTTAPTGLTADAFKDTVGMNRVDYRKNHQNKQISSNLADLGKSSVVPFNLPTFFAIEAGDGVKDAILKKLYEQFGDSPFADVQTAIANGELSKEQIELLRKQLTDQMEELLGPLKVLAVDIPVLSYLEDKVGDIVLGEESERAREAVSSIQLNESIASQVCESI